MSARRAAAPPEPAADSAQALNPGGVLVAMAVTFVVPAAIGFGLLREQRTDLLEGQLDSIELGGDRQGELSLR